MRLARADNGDSLLMTKAAVFVIAVLLFESLMFSSYFFCTFFVNQIIQKIEFFYTNHESIRQVQASNILQYKQIQQEQLS